MSEKGTIEAVFQPSDDANNPVLLNFQNGSLSAAKVTTKYIPLTSDEANVNVAAVSAAGNIYHGIVGDGYPVDLMDSYVAVRNKTTNKVRIIPIEQASLVNYVYQKNDSAISGKMNHKISLHTLLTNYGGKRAARAVDRTARSQIDVDVVRDQLQETVNSVDLDATADDSVATEGDADKIRPPFNAKATTLDEVFNVFDVVGKDVLNRLDDEAQAVLNTDIDGLPIESEYILNQIKAIQESPAKTSEKNILRIKLYIYMDALITLVKSRARYLAKAELSKIAEKVENDIRYKYSDPDSGKTIRTAYTKDKAICYFLVLAVLASDDFRVNVEDMIKSLSVQRAKLVKYAQFVNIKVKSAKYLGLCLPNDVEPLRVSTFKKKRY